ncbi:MAG: type 4a pilus biogenesis protein PilO [Candidatus Omnitrophica bacterium]|nr:type 4a pilus biogenesis protein PilO [Candidatus Omnitrophota bacterium]
MNSLVDKIKNLKFLNTLELDNKKLILIFLISAAVFYFDFSLILKAQIASLSKSSAEVARRSSELTSLERDLKNMQDLKTKKALPEVTSLSKAKRFITESQVSTLLQDISNLANNNDVRILQVKPSRDQKASADTKLNPGPGLTVFYIALDLTGSFHQLGKFINDLENSQVFLMVQELKIDSQKDNYLKQKASVLLKTYVKK